MSELDEFEKWMNEELDTENANMQEQQILRYSKIALAWFRRSQELLEIKKRIESKE